MNSLPQNNRPSHYVRIDTKLCNGCVICMKACPTKAIRVKEDELAHIEGVCIDCGNCIRVCPRGAIKAITTGSDALTMSRYVSVSVSPVIYAQFGEGVMPNDILLALRKVFNNVYDQSYTQELFNVATQLYIQEKRKEKEASWPLISPICPVVNRLISYRFPALLKHILPIITPREIAARELKKRLYEKSVFKVEEIGVYHITPCSAKMISIKEPMLLSSSYIDGALGINEVYDVIRGNIPEGDEDAVLHRSSGIGIGWAISGGEIAGLDSGNFLAVSGLKMTTRYLERIEMGLLNGVEYVEFRACPEGCIGGPMTVADRYLAKHILQKLVRMFGVEKRPKYSYVQKLYEDGWFFSDRQRSPVVVDSRRLSIPDAIKRQREVERTFYLLPKKECGVCGAPDCRTFAEDVVDGKALFGKCVYLHGRKGNMESADES